MTAVARSPDDLAAQLGEEIRQAEWTVLAERLEHGLALIALGSEGVTGGDRLAVSYARKVSAARAWKRERS